jgi:hypothetical protein
MEVLVLSQNAKTLCEIAIPSGILNRDLKLPPQTRLANSPTASKEFHQFAIELSFFNEL